MQGLYIHVPFCKQRCHYCDFYFVTNTRLQDLYTDALIKELEIRKDELDVNKPLNSIYWGGGTPSQLSIENIHKIFEAIAQYYIIDADAEITLEANPEDLTKDYVKALKMTPVNRLSIGIQSTHDEDLLWMNRAHQSRQVYDSLNNTAEAGFNQVSIDFIYGFQGLSDAKWIQNLELLNQFDHIKHFSAYQLTVEPKTPLSKMVRDKKYIISGDELFVKQYHQLLQWIETNGYEQYEISNYCKPGFEAKHNSGYWKGYQYLGIGPSAHSYNGSDKRVKNSTHLSQYIQNQSTYEIEILTKDTQFNEFLMTRLRTKWGIDLTELQQYFGEHYTNHLKDTLEKSIDPSFYHLTTQSVKLTPAGFLLSDQVIVDLFV